MKKSSYGIKFKELRKAYQEVKLFLEQETDGKITSTKKDIEEDLQIAGGDTYELMEKFISVYQLDAQGFDVRKHFLNEGEQFTSGIVISQLLSLPLVIICWLLKVLTFDKMDYTSALALPKSYRQTTGLTFGDLITWYIIGKYCLRKDVQFILK